jgi:GrpB-like predicted nucleotidyltransferase (UPF0157 family)
MNVVPKRSRTAEGPPGSGKSRAVSRCELTSILDVEAHEMEQRDRYTPLTEDYLRAHTRGELKPLSGPIPLVAYDPEWPDRFEREAGRIRRALEEQAFRIEHVGSTSVPDLPAKPIIDILLVVADSADETEYAAALEGAGYNLHIREPGWHEHRLFKSAGDDVNLHVFSVDCPEIARMLGFATGCGRTKPIASCMPDASER